MFSTNRETCTVFAYSNSWILLYQKRKINKMINYRVV